MAKLIITSGPDQGTAYPIGDSTVIGRLGRNPIAIKADTASSRQHARVYRRDGRHWVVDLNSKNGTFLNGELIQKSELRPGDELLVGSTYFRLELEEEELIPAGRPAQRDPASRQASAASASVSVREPRGDGTVSKRALQFSPNATGSRRAPATRTSFAFLRNDLAQTSGLYRLLVAAGALVLVAGLGYLAFSLATL